MKTSPFLEIIRPKQWYKNLLIFLPLIFSQQLFDPSQFLVVLLGFGVLCVAFSGMYIINDVLDSKKDRIHPKKSKRPIPAGRISRSQAVGTACVLLALSGIFSFVLDPAFFAAVSGMILLTLAYSIKVKNIFLLDIVFISSNFVLRAVSGTTLIDASISPWLIIGVFFVALLLSLGKRFNERDFLKDSAVKHRESLKNYTDKTLRLALIVSALSLILAYSAYSVLGPPYVDDWRLVVSLPLVIFIVIRYVSFTQSGKYQGREFHDFIFAEKSLLLAIVLYILMIVVLLYLLPAQALSDFFAFSNS